jgi:hypothetical protein
MSFPARDLRVFSFAKAAEELGTSPRTISRYVATRGLPAVLIGGRPHVRARDLARFVERAPRVPVTFKEPK